eukprot:CAMPEP_0170570376 /NCGR_PEP_ID=MMETSP0224-20130122/1071_1 /TAXON_ID=285029 /ORGANISM="Togula jolla, Strain CCCM 725" /LENGTH=238 /DNA_ID=CAMNT_0010892637 /DNA_START=1293 /DNA_END=2006 /DNA_ORIENTATION=-
MAWTQIKELDTELVQLLSVGSQLLEGRLSGNEEWLEVNEFPSPSRAGRTGRDFEVEILTTSLLQVWQETSFGVCPLALRKEDGAAVLKQKDRNILAANAACHMQRCPASTVHGIQGQTSTHEFLHYGEASCAACSMQQCGSIGISDFLACSEDEEPAQTCEICRASEAECCPFQLPQASEGVIENCPSRVAATREIHLEAIAAAGPFAELRALFDQPALAAPNGQVPQSGSSSAFQTA